MAASKKTDSPFFHVSWCVCVCVYIYVYIISYIYIYIIHKSSSYSNLHVLIYIHSTVHMAEQDTVDLSPRDRITQEGQLLGSVPGRKH